MKSSVACEPRLITGFLEDTLTEDQRTAFVRHLDDCSDCCNRLEQQAADASLWSDLAVYLKPGDADPATDGDGYPIPADVYQPGFLAPTDDPQMLGRFGSCEISGVIGCGGMGIVLKGFDRSLNRFAALKVLAPQLARSVGARKRFAREAQAAAAVVHDNVIGIYGVDEFNGLPYLVMPYIKGESLQKRLGREGALSVPEILRIGMQTARGLAAAHDQGLVHRDVKPGNILLPANVERVMITDFGLARAVDDASLTRSGMIAGTPQYMSPEQARGDAIDTRSDLFSLGSVMYTMCTGRAPFRAETSYGIMRRITDEQPPPVGEINPDIPVWLCRIVERLMSKAMTDRFDSAHDVAALLEKCLGHVQQPEQIPLPVTNYRRAAFPFRRVVLVTVILAIVAVGSFRLQLPPASSNNGHGSFSELNDEDGNTRSPHTDILFPLWPEDDRLSRAESSLVELRRELADDVSSVRESPGIAQQNQINEGSSP